jgi:SAM-dependent methyltransferase
MCNPQSNETLHDWHENAVYWVKHAATIRTMFAPVTRSLIDEAGIRQGDSVIDVAAGAGEPALTIAQHVGKSGSVMCTDAVAEMIAGARTEAERLGLKNVDFRHCEAESLPFLDDTYDRAVSRLGVMFVTDPIVALKEMLRVTKPDGTVSLVVWHKSELNPFCYLITNVMSRHITSPPADPDAPNAFRFAEPGKLAHALAAAGAVDIRERVLEFNIEAPISPAAFWELRSGTSGTLREKLATLPSSEVEQIALEAQAAVRPFFPNNEMSFPAKMLLVTGKKIMA